MITLAWQVTSIQDDLSAREYRVERRDTLTRTEWVCECPDHVYRGRKICKHIKASKEKMRRGLWGSNRDPMDFVLEKNPNQMEDNSDRHTDRELVH